MQPLVRYSYENVVTFGGCQEDFMLVVTSEASSDVDSIKRGLHLLESDRASSEDSAGTTKLLFNRVTNTTVVSDIMTEATTCAENLLI